MNAQIEYVLYVSSSFCTDKCVIFLFIFVPFFSQNPRQVSCQSNPNLHWFTSRRPSTCQPFRAVNQPHLPRMPRGQNKPSEASRGTRAIPTIQRVPRGSRRRIRNLEFVPLYEKQSVYCLFLFYVLLLQLIHVQCVLF